MRYKVDKGNISLEMSVFTYLDRYEIYSWKDNISLYMSVFTYLEIYEI